MLLGVSERAVSITWSAEIALSVIWNVRQGSKCYFECQRELYVFFGVLEIALIVTWSIGDSSKSYLETGR